MKPRRYLLACSLELSRNDKKKIAAIFSGFMRDESDVFGFEDITDMLTTHADIVRQHPTLWLASAEVIGFVQNAAILGRSDFSLDDIRQRATRYVPTEMHNVARTKLEDVGVVLVTGLPGIGKTTLAEQLCLEYVLSGYQLCVLADGIEEAESIYKRNTKQIFYFDDFLGRNYLEALGRHEDSRIVGFIQRVRKDASKRFVLTSRTTVLNQAKILSDQFAIGKVDKTEMEIRVESLSRMDRAKILHKHIWYSDLPVEALSELLSSKRYVEVIDHTNFNPRLIQFLTDAQRFEGQPTQYWGYVTKTLTNPTAVWEHVYDNQLDDFSRVLLLLCCFNGGHIDESQLRSSFEKFKTLQLSQGFRGSSEFVRNARLVTGSVLNRTFRQTGPTTYTLFNPSVADFVYTHLRAESELLVGILASIESASSLRTFRDLVQNKIVSNATAQSVYVRLCETKLQDTTVDLDYRVRLAHSAGNHLSSPKIQNAILSALPTLLALEDDFQSWELWADFLALCVENHLVDSAEAHRYFDLISEETIDYDTLRAVTVLYQNLEPHDRSRVRAAFEHMIICVWEATIDEVIGDSDALDQFMSEDDEDDAFDAATDFVREQLAEYPVHFTPTQVRDIARCVDISGQISRNQRRSSRSSSNAAVIQTPSLPDEGLDELFSLDLPRI